jgi:demethylmenaquinone methyltransferase / 2-methoxy-6-polyprenyl-1,4-benzoquinol methylase
MERRTRNITGALVALGIAVLLGIVHLVSESDTASAGYGANVLPGSGVFFDAIAPTYDLLNRVISLGLDQSWRRAAAQAAAAAVSSSTGHPRSEMGEALDVAAGTGDLTALLLETSAFRAVVALDPSEQMLARLRTKPRTKGAQAVSGVAEELPFADERFQAVTVAFGVRNFRDRATGLKEICRVLMPNGRLVVLEASVPVGQGWMAVAARIFIQRVVPRVGKALSGVEAYKYLSDSMGAFPGPKRFRRMLEDAGFEVLSSERLWPFGTGPDMYIAVKPS